MNQIDNIMEQAQVFASAWALAGGRFDSGDGFEIAEQEKQALRAAIEQAILNEREACAKVCDALQDIPATEPRHCAQDIRLRSEE